MSYLVGFFNLSGQTPDPEDFEGLKDKSPRERGEMGLAEREDSIAGSGDYGLEPPAYLKQVTAVARRRRVLGARAEFRCVAWVTHVAVHWRGRLYVRQIEATPVRPGSVIDFGFTESELAGWEVDPLDAVQVMATWSAAGLDRSNPDNVRRIDIE